ncbi:MAG TPA: hypothetical protein VLB68_20000 [Pyrinomonadaceae bacterium]|nr:hypothetical protein [Pyrinomonadaceae bacterium]
MNLQTITDTLGVWLVAFGLKIRETCTTAGYPVPEQHVAMRNGVVLTQ